MKKPEIIKLMDPNLSDSEKALIIKKASQMPRKNTADLVSKLKKSIKIRMKY